ncbi:MAG: proline iminopeptidase [Actinomycetota bacterium]|jgi:proline iminopeptidase
MEPVAEMLDDVAVVIRWDQRGCGRSDGAGPYTYERFLADLDLVRGYWRVDSCVVGGHSGGASLAMFYAAAYSGHVDGVIYMSGTGITWSERDSAAYSSNRRVRLGAYVDRWNELREKPDLTAGERRELTLLTFATDFGDASPRTLELAEKWLDERFVVNRECNATLGREMAERERWLRSKLHTIECPVLLVHGTLDPRPSLGAEQLADLLPRATVALLDEVGHVPWAEHPSRLETELRNYVASLD